MSAFEELGVLPELIQAVEELGWQLPTPVQAEAVPLILGGGDVMAAAETGSGKTAAFALPVLQVVHEALEARRRGGGGDGAAAPSAGPGGAPPAPAGCRLNAEDRDDVVAVSPDGLTCQARSESGWGGVRATLGARAGKAYFEATVSDEGLCRVGWAGRTSSLDIGTDKASFGYGGTGKKSHARRFEAYGEAYGLHDTLGCCLDADAGEVSFTKNGRPLGPAFAVPKALRGQPLFPAATLKNAQLEMNFGGAAFRHPPPPGFVGLAAAPPEATARWQPPAPTSAADPLAARSPLAIILEPTHELAEQTHANVALFARHLGVRAALLTGGAPAAAQKAALREVPDIVVGTPGRVVQLIETGKLPVDAVQFFVLDEADRLLDTGDAAAILSMFNRFPKVSPSGARLQVLLFSATLHSEAVRRLAGKVCQRPILVDLKGLDAVPDTVDHVLVSVDPEADRSWLQRAPEVPTDGVHALQPALGPASSTPEAASEALKRLKPRLLARLADALGMNQALVFCRTNHDCDALERFLNALSGAAGGAAEDPSAAHADAGGGGSRKRPRGPGGAYSCLVLAGARAAEERRAALQAFKDGDVRFLLATDLAARGLDVAGLPFVVNMTLPERAEDYVHRVGRVGRADAIGLAVSLVGAVPEKVWYCAQKGLKPWLAPDEANTRDRADGGCTAWLDERALLAAVEKRLGQPVEALPADLSLPAAVAARVGGGGGGERYGQARGGAPAYAREVAARVAAAEPAVAALADLERQVQLSFFQIKGRWGV